MSSAGWCGGKPKRWVAVSKADLCKPHQTTFFGIYNFDILYISLFYAFKIISYLFKKKFFSLSSFQQRSKHNPIALLHKIFLKQILAAMVTDSFALIAIDGCRAKFVANDW